MSLQGRARAGALAAFAGVIAIACAGSALAGAEAVGLTSIDQDQDGVGGVEGLNNAYGAAVSPDGDHVYALGYQDSSVATFERSATGELSFLEVDTNGIDGVENMNLPTAVAISPNGREVYVTSNDDALVTFRRNRTTGALTYQRALTDGVNGVDGLASPCCQLAVSSDGRNVYAVGSSDDAVSIFRRNLETGRLSYVGVRESGVGGVRGLGNAIGVVVSRDGDNVYAIGSDSDALVSFERRERTGALRFMNVRKDGVGGVNGMDSPCCSLAISRDGRTVIVPGEGEASLAVFRRSARTGRLEYVRRYADTSAGFGAMQDPIDVVISRDGARVWVASYDNSALLVLRRDQRGRLSPIETILDGDVGADLLGGVWRLAESPDGEHVYAGAYDDDALVSFRRD